MGLVHKSNFLQLVLVTLYDLHRHEGMTVRLIYIAHQNFSFNFIPSAKLIMFSNCSIFRLMYVFFSV